MVCLEVLNKFDFRFYKAFLGTFFVPFKDISKIIFSKLNRVSKKLKPPVFCYLLLLISEKKKKKRNIFSDF